MFYFLYLTERTYFLFYYSFTLYIWCVCVCVYTHRYVLLFWGVSLCMNTYMRDYICVTYYMVASLQDSSQWSCFLSFTSYCIFSPTINRATYHCRNDSAWFPSLSHKKQFLTNFGRNQLSCCEEPQTAPWSGSMWQGTKTCQQPATTSQLHVWDILQLDLLVPGKPSNDCSYSWHFNRHFMRDPEVASPAKSAPNSWCTENGWDNK